MVAAQPVRMAETGSFSAVARERDLRPATVAGQILQFEEPFGVHFVHCVTGRAGARECQGDSQVLPGTKTLLHLCRTDHKQVPRAAAVAAPSGPEIR